MTGLDMLGSPHSSNGGSNGDVVGPPMTPLPPGMSDHIAAAAAQVSWVVSFIRNIFELLRNGTSF